MRDIFISKHGQLLENWEEAFPKASAYVTLREVAGSDPAIFWVHVNANDGPWLRSTMVEIKEAFQTAKIVVLSNTPNQAEAVSVMSNGAVGYCHAYTSADVLAELETVVQHGGVWLGQDLLQTLINASKPLVNTATERVDKALALLTKREKEVALQASKGLSNKEIARELNITERTVKAHISASLEKLGVKDRLQLALVLNDKADTKQAKKTKKATANKKATKARPKTTKKKSKKSSKSKGSSLSLNA